MRVLLTLSTILVLAVGCGGEGLDSVTPRAPDWVTTDCLGVADASSTHDLQVGEAVCVNLGMVGGYVGRIPKSALSGDALSLADSYVTDNTPAGTADGAEGKYELYSADSAGHATIAISSNHPNIGQDFELDIVVH